jgi:hypothetical protein
MAKLPPEDRVPYENSPEIPAPSPTPVGSPTPTPGGTPTPTPGGTVAPSIRDQFGIGEALLSSIYAQGTGVKGTPGYIPGLADVFELWKAGNIAGAQDAYFKTAWAKLDKDVQDRTLLELENSTLYKERLKSWMLGLKRQLMNLGLQADDATLEKYYKDGIDDLTIIDELGGKVGVQGAAGATADALAQLRSVAAANGFNFDKDFALQADGWLREIARGKPVDDFARLIRAQAKLGLPEKVGTLLDQGLDLANIYAPYRNAMASLLELAPDSISLDDPLLRSAYGPDKEMSVYDFKRAIRKDTRWQYTDNAREEVSNIALNVLRDFGFQG